MCARGGGDISMCESGLTYRDISPGMLDTRAIQPCRAVARPQGDGRRGERGGYAIAEVAALVGVGHDAGRRNWAGDGGVRLSNK